MDLIEQLKQLVIDKLIFREWKIEAVHSRGV